MHLGCRRYVDILVSKTESPSTNDKAVSSFDPLYTIFLRSGNIRRNHIPWWWNGSGRNAAFAGYVTKVNPFRLPKADKVMDRSETTSDPLCHNL